MICSIYVQVGSGSNRNFWQNVAMRRVPLKEGVSGDPRGGIQSEYKTVQWCRAWALESGQDMRLIIPKLRGLGRPLLSAASFVKRGVVILPNPYHIGCHRQRQKTVCYQPLFPLSIKLPKDETIRQSFLALPFCENYFPDTYLQIFQNILHKDWVCGGVGI